MCYIFGPAVTYPVHDITPTFLTPIVLSTLRQVDYVAHSILQSSGHMGSISQMPVILIPIHFDRDVVSRNPSCQRSAVIRTFITHDFMTGIPATPNKHLPLVVSFNMLFLLTVTFMFVSLFRKCVFNEFILLKKCNK